jgi:hypothetical protein
MTLRRASLAWFALTAVALTGCATTGPLVPAGSPTTLVAGWEHHFTIDWTTEAEPGGSRRIVGHVSGQQGEGAEPVRLLGQALDASGAVVGQRIEWLVGGINGFQRAYFEIPHLPVAASYRVSVWEYTWRQSPGAGWI